MPAVTNTLLSIYYSVLNNLDIFNSSNLPSNPVKSLLYSLYFTEKEISHRQIK